jgi:hypothetical protein
MGILGDIFDITPTGMVINALGDTFGPYVLEAENQEKNLAAIHLYIMGNKPLNSTALKLQDDWLTWYSPLTWYQRNMDTAVGAEAFNRRNAFMRANVESATEKQKVDEFLKKVPIVDPVTGKPTMANSTGDREVPAKPLISTTYKVVAVATAAGVSVLVLLKKLRIL